ncbi:coiled-coil domain-containing protein 117 [Eleutherodactylus coqui]|uniref:Uncharacterized protein n=1 Tax=Eleutherodactylus coqui TaxID=57060 RepID=A0A8J6KG83_ELECQ|nr:hypothetical protein GDO78_007562 [Eleutherodactylus coqui]KAG9487834.1 hypothetical protein GDO78_007562 [Eleutherodactylus coqui]
MAVVDRAITTAPLYRMEYDQTLQPFLQRANTPGIVDASAIGTSVGERGQINSLPIGSGINSNGSFYMHNLFNVNPSHTGQNGSLFQEVAAQSPAGIPALSPIACTGQPGRSRKHKHQEENNNCPQKKRKVLASPTLPVFQESQAPGIFAGVSGQPFWASNHSQAKGAATVAAVTDQSSAMMQPIPAEDMEEVAVESQSDAALRRIRDIESRLVVEDEDDNRSGDGHLPILVMSDVLVEGFKKGLDESLTKKIVDSINRPSMELVLWKPQPAFLLNEYENAARNRKAHKAAAKKTQSPPAAPLLQEVNSLGVDQLCISNLDTMWNRGEEEEMEL